MLKKVGSMAKLNQRELVTFWLARDYRLAIKKGLTEAMLKDELVKKGYKGKRLQAFLDYFQDDLKKTKKKQEPFSRRV